MSLNMSLVVIETAGAGALSNIQVLFVDQVGSPGQVLVPSLQVGMEEFTRLSTEIAN